MYIKYTDNYFFSSFNEFVVTNLYSFRNNHNDKIWFINNLDQSYLYLLIFSFVAPVSHFKNILYLTFDLQVFC